MILVLLGTQQNDFSRLLKEIDILIKENVIKEEVIAQVGSTKYKTENIKQFTLIDKEQIDKLKKQANYIITHGGVGSIVSSLKLNKKIIAVPRLKEYNEHVNDHQIQIVQNFSKNGYIIGVLEIKKLKYAVEKIETFVPKKYISNTENMIKLIETYIDDVKK